MGTKNPKAATPNAGLPPYAPYEEADVYAIQACVAGTANDGQQKRAIDWIINKAASTYDLSYRAGGQEGDRATAFAQGRAFVGMQIVKMLHPITASAARAKTTRGKRGTTE